jgi:hypothetical protein
MAELTVPQVDFSSLGQLPAIYKQGQADALRQQTLASLGQGGAVDANTLLKSGDLSLAQLGIGLQNRSADDAWRREEAARTQKNADRSYGLQARAASRADEGPVEKAAQRIQLLKSQGIDPTSPEGRAYVISGEWTGPGAGGASLNPVYGVGPDGRPAMVQTTKTGQAIQTKLPDGFQIAKDPIKVDLGTHIQLLDPQTRQPIGTLPKDLAGAETQKVLGEETGKGMVALPQLLATSNQTLQAIENVRTHPGRDWGTGALGTVPGIPGTSQKGFVVALDQLKGKTFLEAFNALRGGGAITEAEGSKATNAMARLDRAQNKQDFESGLNDLRDVVKTGMMRAAAKARGAGKTMASDALPELVPPSRGGITQAQYEALPSGTPFTAPDGSQRVKP